MLRYWRRLWIIMERGKLTTLYNRLDHEQRVEFRNKLTKLINQPVLAQRIENHLANLNGEEVERMLIYTKLLLMS